tara:strand:+ start:3207 stop:5147 length:1941 start_codon:yes stop_codon:yes gene_type:complete
MKPKWLISILLLSVKVYCQDPVILTINDDKVYKSEFEQIYWKNKKEKLATKEDLDEYIDLFVNFKLKVIAAEEKGLDTLKKFINELKGYKNQLERPYLSDTSANDELIKEAYFRTANEINASHIMIKLPNNPSVSDTIKAWNKISEIRSNLVEDKLNFEDYAEKISEDPSAKFNKGNLGFFGAFKMIYSFEEAAYSTAIGEISPIVRTRYGYHILKPNAIRKARGKVKTSHIMIASDPKSKFNTEAGKEKIKNIYNSVISGESFEELAQKFSDDRRSAKKGGNLGWIESGGIVYKEFEDAIFSLSKDGDISKPFQTPNGWHIVKRNDFEAVGSFDDLKYELKNKIQKDVRSQKTINSFINKLKIEYDLVSKLDESEIYRIINNKSFDAENLNENFKSINNIILKFSNELFTNFDFISFLKKTQALDKCSNDKKYIKIHFSKFVKKELLRYEKTQLPKKYPEFKALLKEYRDGILLFEISDQMVWSKAVNDTIGLRHYYEIHKNTWTWPDRVKADYFYTESKELIKEAYKLKKNKKLNNDSILSLLKSKNQEELIFENKVTELSELESILNARISNGIKKPVFNNKSWVLVEIIEIIPTQLKSLKEAEGSVITEYQKFLENSWIEKLRKNSTIKINYDTLYSIREKP